MKRGATQIPIYRTSSVLFASIEEYDRAFLGDSVHLQDMSDGTDYGADRSYGAMANPTIGTLASTICKLEGGFGTLLFPSGLSAITVTLSALCDVGDHVLLPSMTYHRSRRFILDELVDRRGIKVDFYDADDCPAASLVRNNTKLLYIENPTSAVYECFHASELLAIARNHNLVTVVDNSWSTFLHHKPIIQGFDVSICSATKCLVGSSDTMLGTVTAANRNIYSKIYNGYNNYGMCVHPDSCYSCYLGLQTLEVRLKKQAQTALELADWLITVPCVKHVLYPAMPSFAYYDAWRSTFSGANGLLSIVVDCSKDEINTLLGSSNTFSVAGGWGGFKSLILPIGENLYTMPREVRGYQLIRLSCGLEEVRNLIDDLYMLQRC